MNHWTFLIAHNPVVLLMALGAFTVNHIRTLATDGLDVIDHLIVGVIGAITIAIPFYFQTRRQQKRTEDKVDNVDTKVDNVSNQVTPKNGSLTEHGTSVEMLEKILVEQRTLHTEVKDARKEVRENSRALDSHMEESSADRAELRRDIAALAVAVGLRQRERDANDADNDAEVRSRSRSKSAHGE